jgi:hypothetical protein
MCKRLVLCFALTLLFPIIAAVGTANSSIPQESPQQVELRLTPEKSVIRPGDSLKLKVEIWNVGMNDIIIAQNIGPTYINSELKLYLEMGSEWGGSIWAGAADRIPEPKPDVTKTFVTNWLTLRQNHFYGTIVYMEPKEFPELRKPGHYHVKAEYVSGGISAAFVLNAARLNQEDIEKLPFKAWAGTVYSNLVSIQVSPPTKQDSGKK